MARDLLVHKEVSRPSRSIAKREALVTPIDVLLASLYNALFPSGLDASNGGSADGPNPIQIYFRLVAAAVEPGAVKATNQLQF